MLERIQTHIPELDKLLQGGIPKGNITLLSGMPGTGKSILCAQILYENAKKGKKCLYLNLEQDSGRLETQMEQFGWNTETVKKNLKIASVDSSDAHLVEYVLNEIKKLDYDIIVLDSLDSISSTPLSMDETKNIGLEQIAESLVPTLLDVPTVGRLKLKIIFKAVAKSKATALLTSEKVENMPGLTRDTISEFLCDGIIALHYLGVGSSEFRSMQILKMRSSAHEKGLILFEIGKNGIKLRKEKAI